MAPCKRNLKNNQQYQEGVERGETSGQDLKGSGEANQELEGYKTCYGEEKKVETREHVKKCCMHKATTTIEVEGQNSQAMNLVNLTTYKTFLCYKTQFQKIVIDLSKKFSLFVIEKMKNLNFTT
jgi:hypothetical protein